MRALVCCVVAAFLLSAELPAWANAKAVQACKQQCKKKHAACLAKCKKKKGSSCRDNCSLNLGGCQLNCEFK